MISIDILQNLIILYRQIIKGTYSIELNFDIRGEKSHKNSITNKGHILMCPSLRSETGNENYYGSGGLFPC